MNNFTRTTTIGFATVLALAAWMPVASAYYDAGSDLLTICEDSGDTAKGYCLGAAVGYFDALAYEYDCSTKNVTKYQLRDVLLKYINEHPSERTVSAYVLSSRAYRPAFQCKKAIK